MWIGEEKRFTAPCLRFPLVEGLSISVFFLVLQIIDPCCRCDHGDAKVLCHFVIPGSTGSVLTFLPEQPICMIGSSRFPGGDSVLWNDAFQNGSWTVWIGLREPHGGNGSIFPSVVLSLLTRNMVETVCCLNVTLSWLMGDWRGSGIQRP